MEDISYNRNIQYSVESYKQKLGLFLFIIYSLFYSGFVFISVFNIETMDIIIIFGLNLAVFYGMGLIILALILALIYSKLCNRKELLFKLKKETKKS
jgi:uncharacterized membrane protein (DUF485 family)